MNPNKLSEGVVIYHVLASQKGLIGQPVTYKLAAQAGSLGEAIAAAEVMQLSDFAIMCCVALIVREGMIYKPAPIDITNVAN